MEASDLPCASMMVFFSANFSTVLRSRSMWLIGAGIATVGMRVYIIWGTVCVFVLNLWDQANVSVVAQALPHNGGEKNYLEHLFPRPKRLITSLYAANAVLLGTSCLSSITPKGRRKVE